MGFVGDLIQGLLKLFCASQQQTPDTAHSGPGSSSYSQQTQQSVVHQVQPQYPQQQWQPLQRPPISTHQEQQQPNRPHPHKPHHGHGHHGSQGGQQGTPQELASLAPQNQWTSPSSHKQRPHDHPASPTRPTDGRVVRHTVPLVRDPRIDDLPTNFLG